MLGQIASNFTGNSQMCIIMALEKSINHLISRLCHENENFKTKLELAYENIIEPLKVPKNIRLYIVFDSWWFSADLFNKCLNLGYNIVCQIKSDKKVRIVNGNLKFLNSGKEKFLACKLLRLGLRSCADADRGEIPHVERFIRRWFKH